MSCGCQKDAAAESTEVVIETMEILSEQIKDAAEAVSRNEIYDMLAALLVAKEKGAAVFIAGAGRSGLMGRAFAMRLMHMGFRTYVVGDTVTPAVQNGDLLIAISGSGNTKSTVEIARKCKDADASVIAITSKDGSELKKLNAINVVLPAKSKDDVSGGSSKTPMGTSFEILALVFTDSIIMQLIELTGVTEDEMKARHANTE